MVATLEVTTTSWPSRSVRLVACDAVALGEILLLRARGGYWIRLAGISLDIVAALRTTHLTISALVERVTAEYAIDEEHATRDVSGLLITLLAEGVIAFCG